MNLDSDQLLLSKILILVANYRIFPMCQQTVMMPILVNLIQSLLELFNKANKSLLDKEHDLTSGEVVIKIKSIMAWSTLCR